MKSSLIGKAIKAINPSAKFTVHGDNTDTIDWLKETTPISESDIETKVNELKADYDANKYQRDREAEYISKLGNWQDQLDMIYHDIDNWKSEVKKIKDANPKE